MAADRDAHQQNDNSAQSFPQEFAEQMRQRRPGYDRVYELTQKYDQIPPDKRTQMNEIEVADQFIWPMFEALGWSVMGEESERSRASGKVDLILEYQNLRVPVEVRKFGASFDTYTNKHISPLEILTNFETIYIYDFRKADRPQVIVDSSPWSYIADDSEEDDFLAARVFYERLVQPEQNTPSSEISPSNSEQPYDIQPEPQQVELSSLELKSTVEDINNVSASDRVNLAEQVQVEVEPPGRATVQERLQIAIRALADRPSEVDLLGFEDYAQALADFIKSEKTEKPLTIGIDAAWGMGKTTLMRMVQKQLAAPEQKTTGRQEFLTVWFNAWKYDEEESLWAALVLEILDQVRQQMNWVQQIGLAFKLNRKRFDWGLLVQRVARYLTVYIFLVGVLGLLIVGIASLWLGATLPEVFQQLGRYIQLVGGLGFLTAVYAAGKEAYKRLADPFELKLEDYLRTPDYAEKVGFIDQFETDFKRVIDVVTENGKWPLIVFIDDLDRCAPPKPVEIIEAINLLLDSQHCVFILGMDSQTVACSIEAKYKDLLENLVETDSPGNLSLGQRFLEKIIQINFRIPRTDLAIITSFVEATLGSQATEKNRSLTRNAVVEAEELIKAEQRAGAKSVGEAVEAVQKTRPDFSSEVIEQAKQDVMIKSFDESPEVQKAIHEAVPYLNFNPRKIKRFINLLRLQALIAHRRGLLQNKQIQLEFLSRWLLIANLWPKAIQALINEKDFAKRLRQARETKINLDQARMTGNEELQSDNESTLKAYLTDPIVAQLIDETGLISLLDAVDASNPEMLALYLHLAQIGTDVAATVNGEKGTPQVEVTQ